MGIRCADHVTPLYPQKLALTSPTGGGRSVGIVRSRTKATELVMVNMLPNADKFKPMDTEAGGRSTAAAVAGSISYLSRV